jgi:hypothetical protein
MGARPRTINTLLYRILWSCIVFIEQRVYASEQPGFHIADLSLAGAHDINAVFSFGGLTHIMHQQNNGWGHLISQDLTTWSRLQNPLPSGAWDGSLTFFFDAAVILFDCADLAACLPPNASSRAPGDPPLVGVARPSNPSDPTLAAWTVSPLNPIVVNDAEPIYSGPSNIWWANGSMNIGIIYGGSTARFQSRDPDLHTWSLGDPNFYPHSGGGGGLFFPIPGNPVGPATYMLQVRLACLCSPSSVLARDHLACLLLCCLPYNTYTLRLTFVTTARHGLFWGRTMQRQEATSPPTHGLGQFLWMGRQILSSQLCVLPRFLSPLVSPRLLSPLVSPLI